MAAQIDAAKQKAEQAAQKVEDVVGKEKLSGLSLYSRFALAGAVCCSVTHGGFTPVEYVYKGSSSDNARLGNS